MNDKVQSSEEFRKIITHKYTEKGVKPPVSGSEEEKKLYSQWLKGRDKMTKLIKHG